MKFTNISFEKKITCEEKPSLSQYGNETLRMDAVIGDEDHTDASVLMLMDRVHAHLGVEFKSKMKDNLLKTIQGEKHGEGETKSAPTKQPEETKATTGESKPEPKQDSNESSDKESKAEETKEKEVKKEKEAPKKKGTPYNNKEEAHKKEIIRMIGEIKPDWKEDPETKSTIVGKTKEMVGKIMYTESGKVSKPFFNEMKKFIDGL